MSVQTTNIVTVPKAPHDVVDLLLERARGGFAEIDPECKDEPAPILHALRYGKAELGVAFDSDLVTRLLEEAWLDDRRDAFEVEAAAQWLKHVFNLVAFRRVAYDLVEGTNKNRLKLKRRREDLGAMIELLEASTPTTFEDKYLPTAHKLTLELTDELRRNLREIDWRLKTATCDDAPHYLSKPNIMEAIIELTVAFENRMHHLLHAFPGAFVADYPAFRPETPRQDIVEITIDELSLAERTQLYSVWSSYVQARAPHFVSTALGLGGWPEKHVRLSTVRRSIFEEKRTAYVVMTESQAFGPPRSEAAGLMLQFDVAWSRRKRARAATSRSGD